MAQKKNGNKKKKELKKKLQEYKNEREELNDILHVENLSKDEVPFPDGYEDDFADMLEAEDIAEEPIILMGPSVVERRENDIKVEKKISKKGRDKKLHEEKIIQPATLTGDLFKVDEANHVNLGRVFIVFLIVVALGIVIGENIGWFGSLDVHFFKLWPLFLIFVILSFVKVRHFWTKLFGSLATALVFLVVVALLIGGGNLTSINLSGTVKEEVREVAPYSSVRFEGVGDVVILKGEDHAFAITADENVVKEVISEVIDGELVIKYKNPIWNFALFDDANVGIVLMAPTLERIKMTGSGLIMSPYMEAENLEVIIVGSGRVIMDLNVDSLISRVTGSGQFTLTGEVERQLVHIIGAGVYNAEGLSSVEAGIRISGTGKVYISAQKELDVSVSGAGEVVYQGDPIVSQSDISGSGIIRKDNIIE